MKSIKFREDYEAKLKRLHIKTKFTKRFIDGILPNETQDQALAYLDSMPTWSLFIMGAFDFHKLSEKESLFWTKITEK